MKIIHKIILIIATTANIQIITSENQNKELYTSIENITLRAIETHDGNTKQHNFSRQKYGKITLKRAESAFQKAKKKIITPSLNFFCIVMGIKAIQYHVDNKNSVFICCKMKSDSSS